VGMCIYKPRHYTVAAAIDDVIELAILEFLLYRLCWAYFGNEPISTHHDRCILQHMDVFGTSCLEELLGLAHANHLLGVRKF